MKQITVVEGCAGSGKTTFIKEQMESNSHMAMVSSSLAAKFDGDRFPKDPLGTMKAALANDMSKVVDAFSYLYLDPSNHISHVFIDRLVYSQLIYGHIRNQIEPSESWFRRTAELGVALTTSMMRTVGLSFKHATGNEFLPEPDMDVIFLVPTMEELLFQRESASPREFPTGLADYTWYNGVGQYLREEVVE